ncbi:hypothetical protein BU23DRAFT_556529 [Bimuria novae-zelandiae CBS 107.79]|uniref:Uncharacterized protein n=1 Tax=Bimuria novae-zelandiae CBS 107.79 TaxID=1447943 RepID=A0A6A5V756_9PLEO|nr:hypothetical protein BU23DRAFT_556529 [Bimuria novae-zelandiae CBS 107.79]
MPDDNEMSHIISRGRSMNPHPSDLKRQDVEPAGEESESPVGEEKAAGRRGSSSSGSSWYSDYLPRNDPDGHRPTHHELHQSISRSRSRGE